MTLAKDAKSLFDAAKRELELSHDECEKYLTLAQKYADAESGHTGSRVEARHVLHAMQSRPKIK